MKMLKACDVDLVVDATPIECGRDPLFIKEVSEKTGIRIVCATGFFKDEGNSLSVLKAMSYTCDIVEYLTKLYVSEITEGIGDTGIRAGIIKTASSLNEIRELEKILMIASAKAQKITKVPIYTHCERGTMASQQAELFTKQGVEASKVLIGHQTSNRDLNQLKELMREGFYIGFDQFGILSQPEIPVDEEKTANLIRLLKDGYEDHIIVSHDTICDRMDYISKSKPRYPDQIYKEIIPQLRKEGIGEDAIRKITRDNLLALFD